MCHLRRSYKQQVTKLVQLLVGDRPTGWDPDQDCSKRIRGQPMEARHTAGDGAGVEVIFGGAELIGSGEPVGLGAVPPPPSAQVHAVIVAVRLVSVVAPIQPLI